jgi:acetolactate synthase-1/2/3 large subunit
MPDRATVKYADLVADWLVELGYTHCFFVAGGNIMHLLSSVRSRFVCVPVVHETAAGIATEYFNEVADGAKAFALVTAGPGVTNILTAMAGAFLESREQLVIAGQVKSSDLAGPELRQRGIQEIDGVAMTSPVAVTSLPVEQPLTRSEFVAAVEVSGRQGPVYLEFCLDAQAVQVDGSEARFSAPRDVRSETTDDGEVRAGGDQIAALMNGAKRPVWLVGGGVSRPVAASLRGRLGALGVPLLTTWNGADRISADNPYYFGRPNTWGQRSANMILQQADLVIALGTRLGLQQTGFNWQQFAPVAQTVQVDIDRTELEKGHPQIDVALEIDANRLLELLCSRQYAGYESWVTYCREVRSALPLIEENTCGAGYVSPYDFYQRLCDLSRDDDVFTVCSSGGANSVGMQMIEPFGKQVLIVDKGLASMGYGLSGAIGAAFAAPQRRVLLIEGDGGFAQNSQELATVAVNNLNVKIAIFDNSGYASIKMTQLNYFGGEYLGCDIASGLGFPDWEALFAAYGIPCVTIDDDAFSAGALADTLNRPGPIGIIFRVDPEQTYFPKISSRVTESGSMESNPLHMMTPELPEAQLSLVGRYLVDS